MKDWSPTFSFGEPPFSILYPLRQLRGFFFMKDIDHTYITIGQKFEPNSKNRRKHKSETLDDIIHGCAGVRGYVADVEAAAIKADEDRKAGRAWEKTAAKKKYEVLVSYVLSMKRFFD